MYLPELKFNYTQKSRLFLYPLLGIRRGISVTPIETYMSWDDKYTTEDCVLICKYHVRTDLEFKQIEQNLLLNNPLFMSVYELEDGTRAYVFNLIDFKEDYQKIVNGKYSKLSTFCKDKVLSFFKQQRSHFICMDSYVNPAKYMADYAALFTVGNPKIEKVEYNLNLSAIQRVGELCSIPDFLLENLKIKEKIITFEPNLTNNDTL